ncbi:NarL family two-component system sensor histidine kinase LiaS [Natronobacillus azotifigens]|uniref:Sensor histidine kinase n=1 Tax=Natronobacillus azotifigens TaxID=472978 RepID=A0A9J6RBB0_9BACI|nr:sensor histidine kinase [Natronobacillus azotifigens]MCZ0702521.1 sensor histidine kinase [Natronobacillus azotifigens]
MKRAIHMLVLKEIFRSLLFTSLLLSIFLIHFPVDSWMSIWLRTVWQVPFILIVLFISIFIGAISGMMHGLAWKKELSSVSDALEVLQRGSGEEKLFYPGKTLEISLVMDKISDIQRNIQAQTKRTQKLISDRVEDQEQAIEERITEERNRLARELHDSVSQELFATSMLVSAINEMPIAKEDQIRKPIQQVESMIQQAQLEMRALLLHLRPIALKDSTLKEGIDMLLAELSEKVSLAISWRIEEIETSRGVEDHLFRILQESVSNALRHAKANQVDILLLKREGFAILTVIDDGIGFHMNDNQTSSYGLSNMKERAAEIGATFRIISIPNKGTKLEVRVPMIKE